MKSSNFFKKRPVRNLNKEIDPDEIFLDSSNLPEFNEHQFEGRFEKPISRRTIFSSGVLLFIILFLFSARSFELQILNGESYAKKSANNTLRRTPIFPERGLIYDRRGAILAWNEYDQSENDFSRRVYSSDRGFAHAVGYVSSPAKDSSGFYYREGFKGMDGAEKIYDSELAGETGQKIIETNAFGEVESESVIDPPIDGKSVTLSIDLKLESKLYELMKNTAESASWSAGAAAVADVLTGEIIALSSFPEYDPNVMSDRTEGEKMASFLQSKEEPFLNRATAGLYTPGSIVKPFIALAALREGIISPEKEILSTGSISVPNPFDPKKKTVFKDWKAHGLVNMREAIAVSSDVYFYEIGGGFERQRGLGIIKIEEYMKKFGFGAVSPNNPLLQKSGTIPNPEWKKKNFSDGVWRVGDTYNTAIGQYGFQVTLFQTLRAVSGIANGGRLVDPTIRKREQGDLGSGAILPFSPEEINVVREGMREAVISGTGRGLNIPEVSIAAKTGTAELGSAKKYVNSWVIGFFPYEQPRFAFAAIMEKGPYENTVGALFVMRKLFEWMAVNTPEYLR